MLVAFVSSGFAMTCRFDFTKSVTNMERLLQTKMLARDFEIKLGHNETPTSRRESDRPYRGCNSHRLPARRRNHFRLENWRGRAQRLHDVFNVRFYCCLEIVFAVASTAVDCATNDSMCPALCLWRRLFLLLLSQRRTLMASTKSAGAK